MVVLVVLLIPGIEARADSEGPELAAPSSPSAEHPGVVLAAHIPPVAPSDGPGRLLYWQDIQAFYDLTGRRHQLIMYYSTLDSGFDTYLLDQFLEETDPVVVPYIQMDPGPTETLSAIASGTYDARLRASAAVAAEFGKPMLVGFAHEFNGSYMPYYGDPQAYIAAFRHVHDLFVKQGATNVQWVWPPNYASDRPKDPNSDYHLYYPGDAYVDWIAVFGYNWGTTDNIGPEIWVGFDYLFDTFLRDTACRYPKPQLVHTASIDGAGGSKAAWITNTYAMLKDYPSLRSIVWFNDYAYGSQNSVDFRVTRTSLYGDGPAPYPPFTEAYRQAISNPFFLDTLPRYDVLKPATRVCFTLDAMTDAYLIIPGGVQTIRLEFESAPGFTTPVSLSISNPPSGITYSAQPVQPGDTYAQIELRASAAVAPGLYNISVRAEGDGLQQVEEISLFAAGDLHRTYLPLIEGR